MDHKKIGKTIGVGVVFILKSAIYVVVFAACVRYLGWM